MKNILFLTDYSVHSKYSFQYALRITQHFDAIINFGHVFYVAAPIVLDDDIGGNTMYSDNMEQYVEYQYEKETEQLKAFAERQTPKQNHHQIGDYFVRGGDVATEILDIAHNEKIDLIVIGMRQKTKLANALFGNLSLEIMDNAPCPVFLVPKKAMYLGLNNIVYAADFEKPDLVSLKLLLEWAKAFETVLHIIYVVTPPAATKSIPYVDAFLKEFQQEVDDGLIEFQFVEGDIKTEIIQHVKDMDADMVALAKGTRKFWKYLLEPSITDRVIGEVDIPVLVFKRK